MRASGHVEKARVQQRLAMVSTHLHSLSILGRRVSHRTLGCRNHFLGLIWMLTSAFSVQGRGANHQDSIRMDSRLTLCKIHTLIVMPCLGPFGRMTDQLSRGCLSRGGLEHPLIPVSHIHTSNLFLCPIYDSLWSPFGSTAPALFHRAQPWISAPVHSDRRASCSTCGRQRGLGVLRG